MNGEDEIIREALKLEINASDEINRRILQSAEAEPRKAGYGFLRIAVTVMVFLLIFMGTATVVNAATGGKLFKALREKIARWTYVFENGSKAAVEIVEKDNKTWEKITYIEDDAAFWIPISEDETTYILALRFIDHYGRRCYMPLSVSLSEGEPEENMYYAIRGWFYSSIAQFQEPEEKEQILRGLRNAAENTDVAAVRDGLLDLAADYENNRRIFFYTCPGEYFGEEGSIVCIADLTDFPTGNAVLIVDPVDEKQKSQIFTVWIDEKNRTTDWNSWVTFSEEAYRNVLESGMPVYDLRRTK